MFFLFFFFFFFFWGGGGVQQRKRTSNIVATARMKSASEARPSQYIVPFGNTEPTCRPLSGHFMDIEGRVLVYQTERYPLSLTYNASW